MDEIERDAERVLVEYERRAADPRLETYYARVREAFARQRRSRQGLIADSLARLGSTSTLRVIDVGCGAGDYLQDLRDRGFASEHLFGVDLIPGDIELAKARLPGATFRVANAAQLPFDDGTFDAAVFVTVFSSIVDGRVRRIAALEAARVVRRGGLIMSYDLRRVPADNAHLRAIDEGELSRLFDGVGPTTTRRHGVSLIISSRVPSWLEAALAWVPPLLDCIYSETQVLEPRN